MAGTTLVESSALLRPLLVTPAMLDAQGVFEIVTDASTPRGAILELDDGLVLRGLRLTENGIDYADDPQFVCATILVRCRVGASATLVHEDSANVSSAARRLTIKGSGSNLALDDETLLIVTRDQTAQRWAVYDTRGPEGPQGPTGATGETGATGLQGPPGPSTVTTYSGTTSGSGTYSVTFSTAFASTPNVTASLIGGTSNQYAAVTSRSTTGFTVTVYTRPVVSVLGIDVLAGSPTTTNGLTVDVIVVSND